MQIILNNFKGPIEIKLSCTLPFTDIKIDSLVEGGVATSVWSNVVNRIDVCCI